MWQIHDLKFKIFKKIEEARWKSCYIYKDTRKKELVYKFTPIFFIL